MTKENTFLNPDMVQGGLKKAVSETGGSELRGAANFPVDQFIIDPKFNIRDKNSPRYKERVQEIKNSILANGFYREKPIGVIIIETDQGPRPVIHDGHTRYDAVLLAIAEGAPIETLPAVPKPAGTNLVDLKVGLYTQNSSKSGLEPLETAALAKELIGFGLDEKEIARRFGLESVETVRGMLVLAGAPAKVQKLVSSGKVSATLAIKELKADPKGAADRLVTEAAATPEGKKVKAAKVKAAREAVKPPKAPKKTKPATPADDQGALPLDGGTSGDPAPEVVGFVGVVSGPDQSGVYSLKFNTLPPVPLNGKSVRVVVIE